VKALRVLPAADRDMAAAADYYLREANLDVALRFLAAVESSLARLIEQPDAGATVKLEVPELRNHRFRLVKGFEDYLVFYRVTDDALEVSRILHGARDLPGLF
jgi:toxin ParE1/3/4